VPCTLKILAQTLTSAVKNSVDTECPDDGRAALALLDASLTDF